MNNIICPNWVDVFNAFIKPDEQIRGCSQAVVVAQNNQVNRHRDTVEILPLSAQIQKASFLPTHIVILEDEEGRT